MPEMEVNIPEDKIKKEVDKNLDTSGIDGKKILDKQISEKMKGNEIETPALLQKIDPSKDTNISNARKSGENIKGNITSSTISHPMKIIKNASPCSFRILLKCDHLK